MSLRAFAGLPPASGFERWVRVRVRVRVRGRSRVRR